MSKKSPVFFSFMLNFIHTNDMPAGIFFYLFAKEDYVLRIVADFGTCNTIQLPQWQASFPEISVMQANILLSTQHTRCSVMILGPKNPAEHDMAVGMDLN